MNCITYFYNACVITASMLFVSHICPDNQFPPFDQTSNKNPKSKIQLPEELHELHKTFRNDPTYYGFLFRENPDPALIQEFQERFDRAAYALDKMKLSAPLTQLEKEYCYKFGDYLDDPLCHDYLQEISQTPDALKPKQIRYFLAILEDRFLFTNVYHHNAKERYEQNGLDEETKQRTLNMIWQHRYLFATVLHDPILDRLIDHLPLRAEISKNLQEMLVDRFLLMRLKLQDWGFLHYIGDYHVETALYELDDISKFNSDPNIIVDCCASYYSDQEHPHVYSVLFTENHVLRSLNHDLSLLENINIPIALSLKKHVHLRILYEKLLLGSYTSPEQRNAVKLCIRLIMQACTCNQYKAQLTLIAQRLFDEIQYDDVPEILLRYQPLMKHISEGDNAQTNFVAQVIFDLRDKKIDTHEAIALCSAVGA